jgi:methylenetetrahydrofolate dehydrogenase (NADP+)/methenyltetrahydrofolate cyclohydrolase
LDGKAIAAEIQAEIALEVRQGCEPGSRSWPGPPCLAAVLVGDDPASKVYVKNKERACRQVGIESRLIQLDSAITTESLVQRLEALNRDGQVHGILVQLPLPGHLDTQRVLDTIHPWKDVDAFAPENVGLMCQGRARFLPCTPHGVLQLLWRCGISTQGKEVVVIGRSDIVGKPLAMMLLQKSGPGGPSSANATVTCCHSHSRDLGSIARRADILVAALGKPRAITADMIKPSAVVIDVGIHRDGEKLCGDVDFESASEVASAITPVPGGVGPLTIAMLLRNTLTAARLQMDSACGMNRGSP